VLLASDTQLNRTSYYEASVQRASPSAPLSESIEADVVVIGAGFAGLSAALELAQRGYQVVVLEADLICSGASGRNGGQALVGYASGQSVFESQLGMAAARQAWDMSLEAIALMDERIARHGIACDRVHGYVTVADSARKARALEQEMELLSRNYGFQSEFVRGADVQRHIQSPRYQAAALDTVSGHLHPLKYGLGLAAAARACGVRIYERSAVTHLTRAAHLLARTQSGQVRARFGLLAGNCTLPAYAPKVAPDISARIMPVGTYIVGTAPLGADLCKQLIPSNAAVCDNNFVLDYFRFSADHRMLFGGRVSYTTMTPPQLQSTMARRMGLVFPALRSVPIEFVWGGFVDISMNRAPDFGRLEDNLFYLQGFSGHGVALTGLAGKLVAQAIAGQSERFDVFAKLQHRSFPGGSLLRMPALALGMLYYRLRDVLG
jgi:gamma-glutamylputrescine oxidase